jgi:hypothetical protein
MGYVAHHALIVTSDFEGPLAAAHAEACRLFDSPRCFAALPEPQGEPQGEQPRCLVSPIVQGWANGTGSFFVPPDGSKEGWPESEHGDACRNTFINWLRSYEPRYALDWVEVCFGGDYGSEISGATIERCSDAELDPEPKPDDDFREWEEN